MKVNSSVLSSEFTLLIIYIRISKLKRKLAVKSETLFFFLLRHESGEVMTCIVAIYVKKAAYFARKTRKISKTFGGLRKIG